MAFTGKTTYSATDAEVARDVAALISLRAPVVTPVLDRIGDAINPAPASAAEATEHTWRDEELSPGITLICSTQITSVTATEALEVDGWAGRVQVGDVLQLGSVDDTNGVENVQIASIIGGGGSASANSIVLTRAVFGTTMRSATAGTSLTFIANASLEGEAQRPDISAVRVVRKNFIQNIVKPVEVSLTMEQVTKDAGVGSEFDHQVGRRIDEALRDLENSFLRGTSTETIGNGSVYRTMKGLWSWISNTHTVTDNGLSTDFIDDAILSGWQLGRVGGYNVMFVGATAQRKLDGLPEVQRVASQNDRNITRVVRTYESGLSGGPIEIIVTPQMDPRAFIITHTDDLAVIPLQGRSFQVYDYARTGQSRKAELVGEYTAEVRRHQTMIRGYITA